MKLSSKKIITIFCPVTLPLKSGAGVNAFNLAKEFLKLGYKVRVVSFKRENHSVFDNIEGINVVRIPHSDNKIIRLLCYFIIIPIFTYYLSKSNLAIIFGPLQGYMYILTLGKIFNKKILFRSTMLGKDDVVSLIFKFGKTVSKIRRRIIGFMYGYISQSPAMTERLQYIYGNKIPFLESAQGVDTNKFFPVDQSEKIKLRTELNLPLNKKVIISVGYVIERKGYSGIINAIKTLNDYDFLYVVIGHYNPNKAHYMYSAKDEMQTIYNYALKTLSHKIQFIGESEIVDKYLRCADIFILNSKQEGMPNVLLEAMAVGLPIVVKKIEGVDGFISIDNKTALVVENEEQIAKAVKRLLLDEKLTKKLSLNAEAMIFENYTMAKVSKRILEELT